MLYPTPGILAGISGKEDTMVGSMTVRYSASDINIIAGYCAEEVRRQYAYSTEPHALQVAGMIAAWVDAIQHYEEGDRITPDMIAYWGSLIEPEKNENGFRTVPVFIGDRQGMHHSLIDNLIEKFCEGYESLDAFDAYREFEIIHPFLDGNGRTGKIILNWANDSLWEPIFPPRNFWGPEYDNP